jgi:hypothetical protein
MAVGERVAKPAFRIVVLGDRMNKKLATMLVMSSSLIVGAAGAAVAAPAGSESPSNCTFSQGTTTCGTVGAPVSTPTTSGPDANGCTTTTTVTTVTTTYTAHHGTYNSHGAAVASPPSTTQTTGTTTSHACPTNTPTAAQVCRDRSLNYEEGGSYTSPQFGFVPGQTYPVFFTCGRGDGLTLAQAQELTPFLFPACRADRGVSHVYNDDPAYDANPFLESNLPATGWYFQCYNDPSLYA